LKSISPQAGPVFEPRVGCRHRHAQEVGIPAASDVLHTDIQHANGRVPRRPSLITVAAIRPRPRTVLKWSGTSATNLPVSLHPFPGDVPERAPRQSPVRVVLEAKVVTMSQHVGPRNVFFRTRVRTRRLVVEERLRGPGRWRLRVVPEGRRRRPLRQSTGPRWATSCYWRYYLTSRAGVLRGCCCCCCGRRCCCRSPA